MSRKYLDKFFGVARERRTHKVTKPACEFGDLAGHFMIRCVAAKYIICLTDIKR